MYFLFVLKYVITIAKIDILVVNANDKQENIYFLR